MINVYVIEKGSVRPIPKSEKWADEELFKILYISTDTHANKLFAETKPDVICTVGELGCSAFPVIWKMPLYIRTRWIHFGKKEEIEAWPIKNCFKDCLSKNLKPRISVFMSAFESGDRITRAWKSLVAQTCTEWELVIKDDSKSCKTWDTQIRQMELLDCRVRAIRSRCNDGFIGSVKRDAAMICRGEFLVEFDHDDELLPTALEDLIRAFDSDPTVGMVGSDCIELYEGDLKNWDYGPIYGYGFHAYYKQWQRDPDRWVHVSRTGPLNEYTLRHIIGVLNHVRAWRASVYRELGGHNANLSVADDYELILRTFVSKYRIARLPKFLYKQYRTYGGTNFTVVRNAYIQKLVALIKDQYDDAIHKRLLELGMDDTNTYKREVVSPGKNAYYDWHFDPTADLVLDPCPERVSIVMPTYKRPDLLIRAVKSIFAQTFTNWILYIIGDKCPALNDIMKHKKWARDDRIRWWNLSENSGEGTRPRNYALKIATTDYIAYLDDDNTWQPNHLDSLYTALTSAPKNVTFAFSSFCAEKEKINVLCTVPRLYRIDTSCVLHKKILFEKYGYWRSQKEFGYANDWDLFARWLKGGEKWVATKLFTLNYNNANQDMSWILRQYNDQQPQDTSVFPSPIPPTIDFSAKEVEKDEEYEEKQTQEDQQTFNKVINEEPLSVTRYHLQEPNNNDDESDAENEEAEETRTELANITTPDAVD